MFETQNFTSFYDMQNAEIDGINSKDLLKTTENFNKNNYTGFLKKVLGSK